MVDELHEEDGVGETTTTPLTIDVEPHGRRMKGHASLRSHTRMLEVEAEAVRHDDGGIDGWATDLVMARLLRKLEVELMESVHERIDRAVMNE
jgi:hypothetical protein